VNVLEDPGGLSHTTEGAGGLTQSMISAMEVDDGLARLTGREPTLAVWVFPPKNLLI